jgi:hypothetical protein
VVEAPAALSSTIEESAVIGPSPARTRRLRRNPVLAGGLSALAVLLLCWPFVREPPLGLRDAYLHLFAAWTGLILISWWVSRGLTASGAGPDRP